MVPVSRSDDPGFCSAQACFRSAQSMARNAANSVCMVFCPVEIWARQPLPPRKPYSKVLKARRHLRIRLEAKCIPPLEALRMDIECRSERFVTAGCSPDPRWQHPPPQTRARFPQRAAATTVENLFSTSLLRSHYKS